LNSDEKDNILDELRKEYPEKFAKEDWAFSHIHRGNRIFIGTGCGEPRYLIRSLMEFTRSNPKAFFDAEVLDVWTIDIAPYVDEKYKYNFRFDSFFIGNNTRDAINKGEADYTPVFLSEIPDLFERKVVPIDVAMIQTSLPDKHGYLSLGVSVDIVKAAAENAALIIAQVNSNMPRVHGDGFVHIKDIDFIIPYDEPLPEYMPGIDSRTALRIGKYVASLVQDGDTIQVGYGNIPNAVLANLCSKKHLGVHTELLTNGIVELIRNGVIDNSKKNINKGKTVASFCMGSKETYEFINDNPAIEFRRIDYTNNPLIIAQHNNMTAINTALEIDLTGQATAESLGKVFYSGTGGHTNFMRGTVLAKKGKTILALKSTAKGGEISRIVPFLKEGSGISLHRGDVHYVVTEYGIAYLHGKNIRERAMELIAIAHPKFRSWLIEEAKKQNLIYSDQILIPEQKDGYREELETYKTTKSGLEIFLRPVKISDESLLKDFVYSLSDESLYFRFSSKRKDMPHERLQELMAIDNTKGLLLLAITRREESEQVVGIGQYHLSKNDYSAEFAFVIRENYQNKGIATVLLSYLIYIARKSGLLSFACTVHMDNRPAVYLLKKMGFEVEATGEGFYELRKIL
jgi:acyl-CoA hydrolase/RimJ/RimL family protein N-acetyltransferase